MSVAASCQRTCKCGRDACEVSQCLTFGRGRCGLRTTVEELPICHSGEPSDDRPFALLYVERRPIQPQSQEQRPTAKKWRALHAGSLPSPCASCSMAQALSRGWLAGCRCQVPRLVHQFVHQQVTGGLYAHVCFPSFFLRGYLPPDYLPSQWARSRSTWGTLWTPPEGSPSAAHGICPIECETPEATGSIWRPSGGSEAPLRPALLSM